MQKWLLVKIMRNAFSPFCPCSQSSGLLKGISKEEGASPVGPEARAASAVPQLDQAYC